jgi:hypothetical protein
MQKADIKTIKPNDFYDESCLEEQTKQKMLTAKQLP